MARLTVVALRDMLGVEFPQVRAEIHTVAEGAEQRLQSEIGTLRAEMNRRFDKVDDRFDALENDLRTGFNARFDELRAEFGGQFSELRAEFGELKSLIRTNVKRRKR